MFSLLSFLPVLSKQSASPSASGCKYVHFSRDLLQTLNAVHVRRRLELSSPVLLEDMSQKALLFELAASCFLLSCQAGKGIAGFGNDIITALIKKKN